MSKRKVRNRVLGHADEADGIEEYDNPLPDWWVGLFWFTIVWAAVYSVHYHFIAHRSPQRALAMEIEEATRRWPQAAPGAQVEVALTAEAVHEGEEIYKKNCVGCHGHELGGGIGPNLVDSVWIHGGKPEEIVRTITEGVPAKGMLTWGPILGPEKIAQVAAYVISRNRAAQGLGDAGAAQ